ncbi:glycoside hydrolase family 15 protein [Brevibacterium renqingii]|uniref:glycoside hydrolase family 15 protein n=1 Tax=Brevibacterium renqingii TaxID=2776916 RepID=UPI001ADF9F30|nr:glycoside hydrolase family 15 protein [Brevibacterium renqingii]
MGTDRRNSNRTPLEDYALLSDMRTGALLSREGSIDWLCCPRFDSPSVFSALLGDADDGRWLLTARNGKVVDRSYRDRSFIVETIWETDSGKVRITDLLPSQLDTQVMERDERTRVIRRAECIEGTVTIEHDLRIVFDYGRTTPWTRKVGAERTGESGLLSIAGPDALFLTGPHLDPDSDAQRRRNREQTNGTRTTGQSRPDDTQGAISSALVGEFEMSEGDRLEWMLTWHRSHLDAPEPIDTEKAVEDTLDDWQEWASHVKVRNRQEALVLRSLLVLRALTNGATGGIVAAPTTSLPEDFGGQRNWDYRFTWLRDASLTIGTLVDHDFTDGALHWRNWLLRAVAGDPDDVQIMYGIDGERNLDEQELPHLSGYENSRPVRVGNGAYSQYQSDVVGEVMLSLASLRDTGVEEDEFSWGLQKNLLSFVERNFDRKGHGIWEMRGSAQYFTHGRAMMYAAFDQGVRAVEEHGLKGPVGRWRSLRDRLYEEIMEHGFDEELDSFTQTYSNNEVDASLLQLPTTGLVAADDPRMLGTVKKIEEDLLDEQNMVRRYRTEAGLDGLPGNEYSFLMCSFWLVEQYAKSGRAEEGEKLMDSLCGYATDLGLFAEEYDSESGRLAGNYPQAFSHLGFIRALDALEDNLPESGA